MLPVNFGYLASTLQSVPVTVTVTCPTGEPFRILVDQPSGCDSSGAASTDGRAVLRFHVLTASGAVWCDGSAGTALVSGVGTGAPQMFYGSVVTDGSARRVPAGQYRGEIRVLVLAGT
jgi:spore coat protein U-like protein